jgi:serine/threonine-protein kinase
MEPGEILDGKYRIDRSIGIGGMGEVLAATHTKLGKQVAIKVVRAETMHIPGIAERFLREARAASRLRSEHVGQVSDVGELPTGQPYMVMELLDGDDLGNIIDRHGPLSAEVATDYLLQACEALSEAHALGMIHRDIKPANLFVTERRDGTKSVKVLDFGIATAAHGEVSGLTEMDALLGSPQYMSPEQLRSAKIVDARSDIWSLGVTLYELVSQRLPFDGPTFTSLAIKIATEPYTPLADAAPALAAVIDRCLMKDPAKRFADVSELASALARLAGRTDKTGFRGAQTLGGRPASSNAAPPLAETAMMPGAAAAAPKPAVPSRAAPVQEPSPAASTSRDAPPVRAPTINTLGGGLSSQSGPGARGGRGRSMAVFGLIGVGAVGGAIAIQHVMARGHSPAQPPVEPARVSSPVEATPAAPPRPAPVSSRVQIHTTPQDAELRIDDVVVANPLDARFPRSSTQHHIEVRARGYQTASQWITFDADRDAAVNLSPSSASGRP